MISAPVTNREILPEERDKILEVEYHRRCQLRQQLQLSEEEIMSWMKRRSEKDRVRPEAGGPVRGQFKFKRYSQEDLEAYGLSIEVSSDFGLPTSHKASPQPQPFSPTVQFVSPAAETVTSITSISPLQPNKQVTPPSHLRV